MEIQHVNVKLLLQPDGQFDLDRLIPVFHSWIQGQIFDELLLDVADYQHVQAGPGVIVIGHHADYSVDYTDNRPGVRYNRKTPLEGTNQNRVAQAARAALSACRRLEQEPRLNGHLRFGGQEIEIFINDRLLAPNTPATDEALRPELKSFAEKLFPGTKVTFSRSEDPRRLYGVTIKADRPFPVEDLLHNLAS
jgi:hypothetical protein